VTLNRPPYPPWQRLNRQRFVSVADRFVIAVQQKCVGEVLGPQGTVGGCKSADIGCFCRNESFINSIVCCIDKAKACSKEELEATLKYASGLCGSQGVTLPSSVPTCSTATPTATASAGSTPTSNSTAASSSSTAGAAVAGSVGGLAGAVLAMLAAL